MREGAGWLLDECLLTEDWRERGLAVAVFVRRAPDGRRVAAAFVVDLCCFGVREVHAVVDADRADVLDLIEQVRVGTMVRADPLLVARVVRAGRDWGEALGFPAHADYDWASAIFAAIDDGACREPVAGGRFGQAVVEPAPPSVLAGVVARIERKIGRDRYVVVASLAVTPQA